MLSTSRCIQIGPLPLARRKGVRGAPWHPPKSRPTTEANEDWATPNYDQSGGPSNPDAPLHQPPGLRAWAEGDPAEHHQLDVHARLLPKAWIPNILLTLSAAVGKTGACPYQRWRSTLCHQRSAAKRASRHALSPTKPPRCSSRTRAARSWAALQPTVLATVLHHDTFLHTIQMLLTKPPGAGDICLWRFPAVEARRSTCRLAEESHGSSTASAMPPRQARVVTNPDGKHLRTFLFGGAGTSY